MTTRHHSSCECLNIADNASILSTAAILHLSNIIIMERMFLFYTHREKLNTWLVMSTLKVGRLLFID
jgi:hypothetical protein